jgi:hypothetical protein
MAEPYWGPRLNLCLSVVGDALAKGKVRLEASTTTIHEREAKKREHLKAV